MTEPEEDFATLFAASHRTERFERGQTIEGKIVAIGAEVAFVDVGGKGEATIAVDELKDEDGALEVAVGDRIQALVVSTDGGLTLSRKLVRGAADRQQVEDAFQAGLPVEGKVERAVNGGFEVRIARQRAFCPQSQIDIVRDTAPESHMGRVYAFRILEYREGGRKFVVSRRALLEEEQRAAAAELRLAIVPDAVLTGRVVSVRDFGAFVDLGAGIQGLVHVSEMDWGRVTNPADVVVPGDEVTVKVLRVDEASGRIALGLKQLKTDPWSNVRSSYEVGQLRPGRVTRLAQFGAFVELEPGIEALAHASTFTASGRPGEWARGLTVGTAAVFEVLTIDLDKKRIGVAMVEGFLDGEDGEVAAEPARTADDTPPVAAMPQEAGPGNAGPSPSFGSLADRLRGAWTPQDAPDPRKRRG